MRALQLIGVRPAGIIIAGTLVLAFAAPAAAAPGWVPGGRLAITSPQIAMATDGTIVFAGSAPVQPFGTGLSVQVRPPGRPIGPATEIQAHNAQLRGFALAAGTDGRVLIAWGESATVRAAYLAPGATTFTPAFDLPAVGETPADVGAVAVDGQGGGSIAWWGFHDVSTSEVVTLHLTRIPAEGPPADRVIRTFTRNLNDDHSSYGLGPTRLALSDDGRPVLGWLEAHNNSSSGGSYGDSAWAFVPYDVFASAEQLDSTTGTNANGFPAIPDLRVARAGGGRFAIAWSTHTGTAAAPSRTVSLIGNGKIGFGEIAQVIPAGGAELGAIGFLDDSRLLVGVRATTAGRTLPRATICTWVGSTPGCGAAQTLGDADDLSTAFRGPSITTSGGHALAAWMAPDGRGHGTYAPADGQFQAPGTFPGAASNSVQQELPLALAPSGEGVSSLFRPENATVVGDAIGFDATPPAISDMTVPASAVAGVSTTFSGAATDFWGPVRLSWDFGDGQAADGSPASHAYAAAGARTVTLTAADAAGNASMRSAPVEVAAGTAGSDGPGDSDRTAPAIGRITMSRTRFAPASKPARATARRAPRGTAFRFTLSEKATVTITIVRERSRRRKAKTIGSVRRGVKAGKVSVPFDGWVGRRKLSVAGYRATITAVDAAGNRSARSAPRFRIVH